MGPRSLHAVPRDPILRQKWIDAIGLKAIHIKTPVVCSYHFRREDFLGYLGDENVRPLRPTLSKAVVPSQYISLANDGSEVDENTQWLPKDFLKNVYASLDKKDEEGAQSNGSTKITLEADTRSKNMPSTINSLNIPCDEERSQSFITKRLPEAYTTSKAIPTATKSLSIAKQRVQKQKTQHRLKSLKDQQLKSLFCGEFENQSYTPTCMAKTTIMTPEETTMDITDDEDDQEHSNKRSCCVPVCPFLRKDWKYLLPMPTEEKWFKQFKEAIPDVPNLSKFSSRICNFHFKESDFNLVSKLDTSRIKQLCYLKQNVVPTRYLRLGDRPLPSHVRSENLDFGLQENPVTHEDEDFSEFLSIKDSLSDMYCSKDEEAIVKYLGKKLAEISRLKGDLNKYRNAFEVANNQVMCLTGEVKDQTALVEFYECKVNSLQAKLTNFQKSQKGTAAKRKVITVSTWPLEKKDENKAKIEDTVNKEKYNRVCQRLKDAQYVIDLQLKEAAKFKQLKAEDEKLREEIKKQKELVSFYACTVNSLQAKLTDFQKSQKETAAKHKVITVSTWPLEKKNESKAKIEDTVNKAKYNEVCQRLKDAQEVIEHQTKEAAKIKLLKAGDENLREEIKKQKELVSFYEGKVNSVQAKLTYFQKLQKETVAKTKVIPVSTWPLNEKAKTEVKIEDTVDKAKYNQVCQRLKKVQKIIHNQKNDARKFKQLKGENENLRLREKICKAKLDEATRKTISLEQNLETKGLRADMMKNADIQIKEETMDVEDSDVVEKKEYV